MPSDHYNRDAVGRVRLKRNRNRSFTDDAALVALPPANLRVGRASIEAWVSNPHLDVGRASIELWTTPTTVHERVSRSAIETWLSNSGSMRVIRSAIEAWAPAPNAALSLSFGAKPQLKLNTHGVQRGLSPNVAPPLLNESVANHPIFPTLPGITWPVQKELLFENEHQQMMSGKTFEVMKWTDPIWEFTLKIEFLRSGSAYLEQQMLLGLFQQSLGRYGTFLFDDKDDDVATNVVFANAVVYVGSSNQTVFQLVRNFYDNSGNVLASAPVYFPKSGTVTIRTGTNPDGSGGTPTSAFVVGTQGKVIFNTSPVISAPPGTNNFLSWSGGFYYLCRFSDDMNDFEGLWHQFFQMKQLKFRTVKPIL